MTASEMPLWVWIVLPAILLAQASWIFCDASKRGENKWLWGLFGLIQFPSSLILYLIITRIIFKHKSCKACGRKIKFDSVYCSYCGVKTEEDRK